MKKSFYIITVLMIALIVDAFGQKPVMELSFTAVNNEEYVPLDSILIENLTQGSDTILYAPDTVLVLEYVTSITDNNKIEENSFIVSQNYPNPFQRQTSISIYFPEKEYIEINILDIWGVKVASFENTLNQGNHSFTFYPGKEKYYLFSVTGKYTSNTIKMLNMNSNPAFTTQCKMIYNGYDENKVTYKSQKAINNFVFALGDQLRFTGYAKTVNEVNGSSVIEDTPQNNEMYEFDITEGIPCPGVPTVTYEWQVYHTVQIGDQCWLKENLNEGTMINGSQNQTNNSKIEKYCYDNDEANCDEYGGLYQWDEMMQYTTTQGVQGICPDGWHLPTDYEWTILINFLGGTGIAGGKMKEADTTHWWYPNTGATNEYGFTALPSGYRYPGGDFGFLCCECIFWSSVESTNISATGPGLHYHCNGIVWYYVKKQDGFSVRCLKD